MKYFVDQKWKKCNFSHMHKTNINQNVYCRSEQNSTVCITFIFFMNTDDWCHKHLKDRWLVYFNTDNLNLLGLWTQCSGAALHTGQLSVQVLFSTKVNSVFRCCSPHRSTQCSGAALHTGQLRNINVELGIVLENYAHHHVN